MTYNKGRLKTVSGRYCSVLFYVLSGKEVAEACEERVERSKKDVAHGNLKGASLLRSVRSSTRNSFRTYRTFLNPGKQNEVSRP